MTLSHTSCFPWQSTVPLCYTLVYKKLIPVLIASFSEPHFPSQWYLTCGFAKWIKQPRKHITRRIIEMWLIVVWTHSFQCLEYYCTNHLVALYSKGCSLDQPDKLEIFFFLYIIKHIWFLWNSLAHRLSTLSPLPNLGKLFLRYFSLAFPISFTATLTLGKIQELPEGSPYVKSFCGPLRSHLLSWPAFPPPGGKHRLLSRSVTQIRVADWGTEGEVMNCTEAYPDRACPRDLNSSTSWVPYLGW